MGRKSAKMTRAIIIEGWLIKYNSNKPSWLACFVCLLQRWRRRWFALRQSGELPGQYFLDYYADRNCRRLKGTIDLDLCEQVDAGLHMERHGQAPFNPNIRGSVFTIQTQRRTYHLEADCEAEMEQWVDAICRVCGLRAMEELRPSSTRRKTLDSYPNNVGNMSAMNDHYECADGTGPYIPISECITGVRAQDEQRAFTFDPKNIVMSTRHDGQQLFTQQPHNRVNSELSENDSNMSEDDDASLHASHQNLHWAVTKSFTKLAVTSKNNGSEDGPPVPPRPPKTIAGRHRDVQTKESLFQGPKIQEPVEAYDNAQRLRVPRRMSQGAPSSPGRLLIPVVRCAEEEEDFAQGHGSMQYCNLPSLPPAVDRALKPRHSSHSVGHINALMAQGGAYAFGDENRRDVLQYLDLDLHTSKPPQAKKAEPQKKVTIAHGKSMSAVDTDCAYKTVDFLKTEAFNITRQDAEASRSGQY